MEHLIGIHIKYYDYLGFERFGRILHVEPSNMRPDIVYIYIDDEEPEFNIHDIIINGELKMYAEIRTSDEIYIDDDNVLL